MNNIQVIPAYVTQTILAGANAESNVQKLDQYSLNGFFSAQILLTGDGTAKVQWGVSNDGTNFIYSSTASDDIVTAFVKTTGPGADGKNIYSFDPIVSLYLRFKVTETGSANSIIITMDVAMH